MDEDIIKVAMYLIELPLLEYKTLVYRPSQIAASALYLSLSMKKSLSISDIL